MANEKMTWYILDDLVERVERYNVDGKFGLEDIRGVSNTKQLMPTKANMTGRDLTKFLVIEPNEFVFNRRTTRNGERLGMGFNNTGKPIISTEDYVAFGVKKNKETIVCPEYLYILFKRDEFDRYVRYNSWGSATEFFNWEEMQRVPVPLPSIEKQHEIVAEWKGLREMKEQNEQIAQPLMELCQSFIEECKKKYPTAEIGPLITKSDSKNSDNKINIVKSVSVTKTFNDTNAKVDKNNLKGYKIVKPGQISFVQTTGNEKCLCIAVNHYDYPIVVTSVNEVFETNQDNLLADYLHLYCCRKETDRYVRFHSWGSARETFTWLDMCRFKIPLPPIEVQQAIVNIYKSAQEAKKIAEEADKLSNEICPALIQHVIHS